MHLTTRAHLLQYLSYAALSSSLLVMPLYAVSIGASYPMIGLIGASYGLASIASNVVFGRLGDRADRRVLLLAGFAAASAAYLLQFFAARPEAYLAVRFAVGVAAGVIPATLVAYVYELRRPIGKFTSYNALGFLTGSLLILVVGALPGHPLPPGPLEAMRQALLDVGPLGLVFLASALFSATAWLLALGLPPMRIRIEVPLIPVRVALANGHVYGSFLLRHVGATAVWTIFPLYVLALGGSISLYGALHAVNMLSQVVVFRGAERFRRLGHPRVLIAVGLVLSVAAFVGYAFARTAPWLVPFQVFVGLSFGALWLGNLREVLDHNLERATATGLLNASVSLGQIVGPLVGGLVAAAWGFRAVMLGAAAVTVLGLGFFVARIRSMPPRARVGRAAAPGPAADVAP